MSPPSGDIQGLRRERLAEIADQFTKEIYEKTTAAQLAGGEPVSRYAAVTSEGTAESTHAANGKLLLADTTDELAVLLAEEAGEGWPTHGRVWDLDGGWDPWGNLTVTHRVELCPPSEDDAAEGR